MAASFTELTGIASQAFYNLNPLKFLVKQKSPECLLKIETECHAALNEIDAVTKQIIDNRDSNEKNLEFFSKAVFQKKIDLSLAAVHLEKLEQERFYIKKVLQENLRAWEEKPQTFQENQLQQLKKDNRSQIIFKGQEIAQEYFIAAEQLKIASRKAFAELEQQERQIIEGLKNLGDEKNGALQTAITQHEKANREWKELDTVIRQEKDKIHALAEKIRARSFKIDSFNILKSAYDLANSFYAECPEKIKALKAKYTETEKLFDVSKNNKKNALDLNFENCSAGLRKQLGAAEKLLTEDAEAAIFKHKRFLLQEKLVRVLNEAINNVDFWYRQVAWCGSKSKLNNMSVPTGIAIISRAINLQDADFYPETSALTRIQKAAALRRNTQSSFFAPRNQTTTGKFYEILQSIKVEQLTEKEYIRITSELAKIQDDQGVLVKPIGPGFQRSRRREQANNLRMLKG